MNTLPRFAPPAAAAIALALELLTFRQIQFAVDALAAQVALSVAVLGVALGGLFAWELERRHRPLPLGAVTLFLAASVILTFVAFPLAGTLLCWAAPVLVLPYFGVGVVLATSFARWAPGVACLLDLGGASAGALVLALALGPLGEEGTHALVAAGAVALAMAAGRRAVRIAGSGVVLALGVFALTNSRQRYYDLAKWTGALFPVAEEGERGGDHVPYKVFFAIRRAPAAQVLFTRTSLAGRVDIVSVRTSERVDPVQSRLYENGNFIDRLRPADFVHHRLDPRVPAPLLPAGADVFVGGTSIEGILESLRYLGANVKGVERNTTVVQLARGPAAELCGNCYDGVEVEVNDARAVLARSDRSYDMITLMNTYVSRGGVDSRAGQAEFLHSVEAVATYLDRLSPNGFVNWEIPRFGNPGVRVSIRQAATAMAALRARGVLRPEAHILAYQWGPGWVHLLVRRSAWQPAEVAAVEVWLGRLPDVVPGVTGPLRVSGQLLWPGEADHPLANQLRSGTSWERTTDDRPFPFADAAARARLSRDFLGTVALAGAVLVGVGFTGLRAAPSNARIRVARFAAASGLLGMGYLMVQSTLSQQVQALVSTPGEAVAVVLVVMLACSGLGGWLATSVPRVPRIAMAHGLPLVLVLIGLSAARWGGDLIALPDGARLAVTGCSVGLVAFLMGMPFPMLLGLAKDELGSPSGAILYGANGSLAALGPLASLASLSAFGFRATWVLAAAAYFVAALLTPRRP